MPTAAAPGKTGCLRTTKAQQSWRIGCNSRATRRRLILLTCNVTKFQATSKKTWNHDLPPVSHDCQQLARVCTDSTKQTNLRQLRQQLSLFKRGRVGKELVSHTSMSHTVDIPRTAYPAKCERTSHPAGGSNDQGSSNSSSSCVAPGGHFGDQMHVLNFSIT